MAKQQVDYNLTDKITVTTKFDKEDAVIADYAIFGWELYDRKEDKVYFDAVHLTFIRKHKINNKDQLQLLQVYYEDFFNQLSDCQKYKHKKSNLFTFISSVFIFALLALCVYMIIFADAWVKILFGTLAFVCLVLGGFVIKINRRIQKQENEDCSKKNAELKEEIDKILTKCTKLIGGTDEKQKD